MEVRSFVKVEVSNFHFAQGHDVLRLEKAFLCFVDPIVRGELNEEVFEEGDSVFCAALVVVRSFYQIRMCTGQLDIGVWSQEALRIVGDETVQRVDRHGIILPF